MFPSFSFCGIQKYTVKNTQVKLKTVGLNIIRFKEDKLNDLIA